MGKPMNDKEIRRYLNVIKRAVSLIEGLLDNDDGGLLEQLASSPVEHPKPEPVQLQQPVQPETVSPAVVQPKVPEVKQNSKTAEEWNRFAIDRGEYAEKLLSMKTWPEAVPEFLVAQDASTDDQINRANAVLDMMVDRPLENVNFLDFGCGDGWIAQEAAKRGVASSTGFDIKLSKTWSSLKGATYTHIYNELKRSYYDVVMLYDVLDHCEDPLSLMDQVKNVLKRDGIVYVRCHPWTARHATHMYKQGINRAYLHLFLTYDELLGRLGQPPIFTRIEKNPIEAYHWWFHDFEIKSEKFIKEPVSDFFSTDEFREILAREQEIPKDQIGEFLERMRIQFVDYRLIIKK